MTYACKLMRHEEVAEGPMGSFRLHTNGATPAVFLTGGIGITPFLGILRQVARGSASPEPFIVLAVRT